MRITEYYNLIKQTNPGKNMEEILEDVINISNIKKEYERKDKMHAAELNELTKRLSNALNNEYEMSKQLDYMSKRNEELTQELKLNKEIERITNLLYSKLGITAERKDYINIEELIKKELDSICQKKEENQ